MRAPVQHTRRKMREFEFVASSDRSVQKALFYHPGGRKPVPVVVGLHTWSCDRFNQVETMQPCCRERNWALLLPEFRGPNLNTNPRAPEACASPLARQDILDALAAAAKRRPLDPARVFLLGGSGGGHMALMMAAFAPRRWRGVSAWCPVTDLAAWYRENPNYAPHVAACCGGPPGSSARVDREYRRRSPLFHVRRMVGAALSVHHGRDDSSVPCTQTRRLALALERLRPKRFFWEIFDGGHEIRYEEAFRWFDRLAQTNPEGQSLSK